MSDKPEADGFANEDIDPRKSKAMESSVGFVFDFPELREAFKNPDAEAAAARLMSRVIGVTGVFLVLVALMLASATPFLTSGDHKPECKECVAPPPNAAAPAAEARQPTPEPAQAEAPVEDAGQPVPEVPAAPAPQAPVAAPAPDASHEPVLHEEEEPGSALSPHELLGIVAAVVGLLGTAMGIYGMGKRAPRHQWLSARLKTETLRLFQFHYLACRMPEIVINASNAEWRKRFEAERAAALIDVQAKLLAEPDKELQRITKGEGETPFETFIQPQPVVSPADPKIEADAIAAWRELRLGWQETYVKTKLAVRDKRGLTARGKEQLFHFVGWACVGLIIGLHMLFFLHLLAVWPMGLLELAVIWTALVALTGRALEDGYAPHREVERYEQYEGNIRVAIERFEAAEGFPAKLEVARAFERTSLEEMRVFIRTQAKTRFLL